MKNNRELLIRLQSLLLAGTSFMMLSSCNKDLSDIPASATPTPSITEPLQESPETSSYNSEVTPPSAKPAVTPSLAPSKNPEVTPTPVIVEHDCHYHLEDPLIAAELTKMNNGEAFRFPYVTGECERGISSIFNLTGPLFKQLEKDGVKYLVLANNENKVLISGYDWLGYPYYLQGYDQANGGMDPKSEFSGWVIPAYTNIDREDPVIYEIYDGLDPGYTFNLYDFETFKPLIIEAEPDIDFKFYGPECFGVPGPIIPRYVQAYDHAYGGKDKNNKGAGLVMEVEKWNHKYLVDVNDFKTIIAQDYNRFWYLAEDNVVLLIDKEEVDLTNELINPVKSDILTRERKK